MLLLSCCWLSTVAAPAPATIQFDVFLGYDGIVPEASWFPVVFEVKNDGPSFVGKVEVAGGRFNEGQMRRIEVELPTGTLKRFVVPVFSSARGFSSWNISLYDEKGKVRAEQKDLQARKQVGSKTPVIGALARTPGGVPILPPIRPQQADLQPVAARLLPAILPDNPLTLEGLSCIYLNSEKASELSVNQANAVRSWMLAGGHLVVGMEQVSDLAGSSWLEEMLPVETRTVHGVARHPELHEWLRGGDWQSTWKRGAPGSLDHGTVSAVGSAPFANLPDDFQFEASELQVITCKVRDGRTVVAAGDTPLMVTSSRGNGRLTVLLFSPEREPMRSWKHLSIFWAKLADVPGSLYVTTDNLQQGGWSTDGVVGAMIDSRQVHKLPIGWLFVLLLVYLVVIGPLDHYWLKRIGRPMLTWITFPCYVVAFSLVIYLIGYKLRSGETEWNELHIVDVLKQEARTELRGRTYASAYSPSNARFRVESQQRYANLRGEFTGSWGSSDSGETVTVQQNGDSFKGQVFVPVWTSQLFVNDWHQPSTYAPVVVDSKPTDNGWTLQIENRTDQPLTGLLLVQERDVQRVGDVPAKQTRTFNVVRRQGLEWSDYFAREGAKFGSAVMGRQRAFGGNQQSRLDNLPEAAAALSFISLASERQQHQTFVAPPGLDLVPNVRRGSAILVAWSEGYSPVPPLQQFKPKRSQRHTLWRWTL